MLFHHRGILLFFMCALVALTGTTGAQQPRIRLATLAPKGTSIAC